MIERDGPGAVTLGAEDRALAVAEVKAVLRIVAGDEDALIAAFAETALGLAEQFLGVVTLTRPMADVMPGSRAWQRIGAGPVRMIGTVEAADDAGENGAGEPVALSPGAYAIDIDAAGDGWLRLTDPGAAKRVRVSIVAGIADDWSGLPLPIRQGAVLLAAYLFETRDAAGAPPVAVTALWRPFRRIALMRAARAC